RRQVAPRGVLQAAAVMDFRAFSPGRALIAEAARPPVCAPWLFGVNPHGPPHEPSVGGISPGLPLPPQARPPVCTTAWRGVDRRSREAPLPRAADEMKHIASARATDV